MDAIRPWGHHAIRMKLYYPLMKDAFWPSDGAQRVLFMDDPNAFLGRVLKGRERAQRGVPCSERRLPTMKSLKAVFGPSPQG